MKKKILIVICLLLNSLLPASDKNQEFEEALLFYWVRTHYLYSLKSNDIFKECSIDKFIDRVKQIKDLKENKTKSLLIIWQYFDLLSMKKIKYDADLFERLAVLILDFHDHLLEEIPMNLNSSETVSYYLLIHSIHSLLNIIIDTYSTKLKEKVSLIFKKDYQLCRNELIKSNRASLFRYMIDTEQDITEKKYQISSKIKDELKSNTLFLYYLALSHWIDSEQATEEYKSNRRSIKEIIKALPAITIDNFKKMKAVDIITRTILREIRGDIAGGNILEIR